MDKKFIRKEFNEMEVPEIDVRENVLSSIHGKKDKSRKKIMPKTMVAIGLILIMITGVVFAAGKLINVVVEEPVEDEIARYKMNIEVQGIELDYKVSEDLIRYATNPYDLEVVIGKEHYKGVESYNEVEKYLGIDLLQSPILNNSFDPSLLIGDTLTSNNINISSDAIDEKLVSVYIDSQHSIGETDGIVFFGAYLLTPFGKETVGDYKIQTSHFDHFDNSKREVLTETYTSEKSGITAEIVHISETNRYSAYFELDSIVYILESSYAGKGSNPRDLIIEVIDSFEK